MTYSASPAIELFSHEAEQFHTQQQDNHEVTFPYPAATATDITILYEDAHVLAVDKPPGLLAVPGRGPEKQDCLLRRLTPQWGWLGVVHRLDQATSGVMLLARTEESLRLLHQQFRQRATRKRYLAVVWGCPYPSNDTITLNLMADWPNRPRQKVDPVHGKPCTTHYRTLTSDPLQRFTLLELEPVTGRTHQLRVHLMHRGHPIVGDTLYGQDERSYRTPVWSPESAIAAHPSAPTRMLLHAHTLTWTHPVTGTVIHTVAECSFAQTPILPSPSASASVVTSPETRVNA
jgi:tRNA pseudouridine32 synthase/23S rRNA pseudouridine746 synthase